jgi:CRISPR-associated endonuclease/helicase Cas3
MTFLEVDMTLWPHQERVFNLIMAGKNVILQSPTGSGKTRAALYPFLTAWDDKSPYFGTLPRKCIYSVPMRVLAKQFHHEYTNILHTYNLRYGLDLKTAIQTGEQSQDKEFATDLIFATIDQTLSSFLISPYSLPKRKANLNAAAVMASYLVFDEFHLYDPESTLPTTLHMLKLLKGVTPFILMTATFSQDMLQGLAKELDAEVVPLTDQERLELQNLESQQKTRRYHALEEPLTAESVLNKHLKHSLVICNVVDRAHSLYDDLCEQAGKDTQVLLLHSRFLPEDRQGIEDTIRQRFSKDDDGSGSLIVVSTQAIEVGLDITCTRLHTELAPANAVIQRAGRCARYPGNEGDVYIYRYSLDAETKEIIDLWDSIMPYSGQKDQITRTFEEFQQRSGEIFKFEDEQGVISAVHGKYDAQIIQGLKSKSYEHLRDIFSVMRGDERVDPKQLIRDGFQQRVTISADPNSLLDSPFDAPAFSLHPSTLQKYAKRWQDRFNASDDDIPWAIKYLAQTPDPDESNRSVYKFEDASQSDPQKTLRGASLIVVHPLLATYSDKLGFIPDRADHPEWQATLPKLEERSEGRRFGYRLETYEAHIQRVYEAAFEYKGMWSEMSHAAQRLERLFGWESGSLRKAAELAVLLHDVGKLSQGWQGWVRDYQHQIGGKYEPADAYAHTELQNDTHREVERAMKRRPWHAVEGAIACLPILEHVLSDHPALLIAVYSAIARHHAPHSYSNEKFRLTSKAQEHIRATLPEGWRKRLPADLSVEGLSKPIGRDWDSQGNNVIQLIDNPNTAELACFLTYLLMVRVLRRADALGTERGTKGI